MILQFVASPLIIILTTVKVSFIILENIYYTDITYDCHLQSSKYFHNNC